MDDTCAVCAESLDWVAYGQCGHREVCSTCIARLRFICEDHRCCICKSESNVIFVTKGLGDYTRMINDFSIFPVDLRGGRIGAYWYHEETQAFFDDLDHFNMIVSMCKLSCIVCKEKDEQGSEGSKRRSKFRNIEQLKSHLFHRHSLLMCSLCLEGRKIFISEQKLYTRSQLNQHIKIGDLEVDGSVSERGGFMGHPMCEFCRNPFYGDNELYSHMSTEHYTCHMCQRQRPGQYDYFRDYDDLEVHFRREHFLCEDEACLAKKFMVFATELEIKRHNNMEHGGRMSRSKRNAALRIPISFQYQRSREQDQRGRGHGSHPDYSDSQLSLAIRASLETANADTHRATSSRAQADSDHRETSEIGSFSGSFETLVNEDSEPPSRYRQAVGANVSLEESSFPPLPVTAKSSKRRNHSGGLARNTMAAHLRRRSHVTVLHSSQALPAASHQQPTSQIGGSSQLRPMSNSGRVLSSGSASSSIGEAATVNGLDQAKLLSSMNNGLTTADALPASSVGSSTKKISKKVSHSNFAAVSATHSNELRTNTPPLPEVVDVQIANTSLVERIRADLEFNEEKYAAFKVISSEYRQGIIDTGNYLAYVHQFGLSHLILELARLCPDALKQKELVEACSSSLRSKVHVVDNGVKLKHQKTSMKGKEICDDNGFSSLNGDLAEGITNSVAELRLNSWPSEEVQILPKAKGKEKCDNNGISSSDGALAEGFMTSVAELRRNYRPSKEVQVLSKDGYRAGNGNSMYLVHDEQADLSSGAQPSHGPRVKNHSQSVTDGSKKTSVTRGEGGKPRKKTSKFHRVRLGESSAAAVLDLAGPGPGPDPTEGQSGPKTNPSKALPVRGAWQNGGGRKLVANWQ